MKEKIVHVVFISQYIRIVFLCSISIPVFGNVSEDISIVLSRAGFENIRVHEEDSSVYISFENTIYRWNVKGIIVALDSISTRTNPNQELYIALLSLGIPRVIIHTKANDWKNFRNRTISSSEFEKLISVSYDTSPVWKKVNHQASSDASYGKLDLVLYPQVKLANVYYDQFFDTQINMAPTLELSLWKGAKGTLQYIIPFTNSGRVFGKNGNHVRPGFATITQQFRIYPRFYTDLTVGLFNHSRAGIDLKTSYHLSQSISLKAEAGYTGLTNIRGYLPENWTFTTWDRLTWMAGGDYFNKQYSLQISGVIQRFLTGDTGLRVDMTRLFGEVAIGFYGIITENDKNAGFHIAIPLPGQRRPHWNRFRIMLPKYFDWEYTVANNNINGASFEVRPNENRIEYFFNPDYLKSQILKN
jgi:hypothetical protein